jgi:hypothetical protein
VRLELGLSHRTQAWVLWDDPINFLVWWWSGSWRKKIVGELIEELERIFLVNWLNNLAEKWLSYSELKFQWWFKETRGLLGKTKTVALKRINKEYDWWFSWRIWLRNAWVIQSWSFSPNIEFYKKTRDGSAKFKTMALKRIKKECFWCFFFVNWPSYGFLMFRVYLQVGNEPEVNQKNPSLWCWRGEKKNNFCIFLLILVENWLSCGVLKSFFNCGEWFSFLVPAGWF